MIHFHPRLNAINFLELLEVEDVIKWIPCTVTKIHGIPQTHPRLQQPCSGDVYSLFSSCRRMIPSSKPGVRHLAVCHRGTC